MNFILLIVLTGLINWKTEISSDLKPVVIGKLILTISERRLFILLSTKNQEI